SPTRKSGRERPAWRPVRWPTTGFGGTTTAPRSRPGAASCGRRRRPETRSTSTSATWNRVPAGLGSFSNSELMATTPDPGDDFGLFGPESVAWRLHREPALLVGGLSALMVQALHPLAIAAVADHSDYKNDVWGRYDRTTNYVVTTIYGTTKQALAVGARVRAVHAPIRGVDSVTGLPY